MRIGLLSDTHGFLDEAVFKYFAECDEVWHAGDIGAIEVLHQLQSFKPTRAVFGNIDGAKVRAELPGSLAWTCEDVQVYMKHIGGYPGNYDAKAKKDLARLRPGLFICGHSHILKIMRDPALGLIHMNPGASGHNGWHKIRTMIRFSADAGKISGVEAIELGPRGRTPPQAPIAS